jgi:hypothetical protein
MRKLAAALIAAVVAAASIAQPAVAGIIMPDKTKGGVIAPDVKNKGGVVAPEVKSKGALVDPNDRIRKR